jgi:CheY-like chemotaxis protein
MLRGQGHHVHTALSGPEALAILGSGTTIDLLVTDQAMPGMTGVQLAREIRSSRPRLPILLVSGYSELIKESGETLARLDKPFSADQLAAAVAEVMVL